MTPVAPIAFAASATVGALVYATVAPACRFWGPVISRGDSAYPRYALTFDDGPSEESTPRILEILTALNVKATFFVIGRNAQRNPGLVQEIHAQGHIVANHTYDHSHFGMMRAQRYWNRQVGQTDELIQSITGRKPTFFRPPMGVKTWHVTRAARLHGHALITWTRRGFDGMPTTAEQIIRRLSQTTAPGDILMLHDGIEPNRRRDPSATVAAVAPLIKTLRDRGLEPSPLDQLIGLPAYASV